jgi:hypothetical protein
MAAVLHLSATFNLFVRMALAAFVYGIALLAFRVVSLSEIRLVLGGDRPDATKSSDPERI